MVDMKKEQEHEKFHRVIWAIADELRGAVVGWDFKDYVLGTMSYRYISKDLESYIIDVAIQAVLGGAGYDWSKFCAQITRDRT